MKHLHQNQEFRFNEVLFEHRNKEYGAYVLRNESDRILTKALFVGVSLLAAVSITPFVINAFKSDALINDDGGVEIILKDPVIPDDVVVVPPKANPIPPSAAPRVKQYDTTVPTPSRTAPDTKKEDIPDDAIAGFKNDFKVDPAPVSTYTPIQNTENVAKGPVAQPVKPEVPKQDNSDEISYVVDVEAAFPGGIDSFRNKVMNKFDASGFENEGAIKTTITFIVEKDGTISGIKADGANGDFNSEALRTIKSIKGKWIPAKVKGQPVRSYFKFPISMKFDN